MGATTLHARTWDPRRDRDGRPRIGAGRGIHLAMDPKRVCRVTPASWRYRCVYPDHTRDSDDIRIVLYEYSIGRIVSYPNVFEKGYR